MKYAARYVVLTVILAAVLFCKVQTFAADNGEVESFRGASLPSEVWNPLIADSVNGQVLTVLVDSQEYTSEKYDFYMDENMNIMAPASILRDALKCSAHVYDGDTLLIEKRSDEVELYLGETTALVNGEEEQIASPMEKIDGEYYVSLGELAQYLDYSYSWDIEENMASAADTSGNATVFPATYDLRTRGRVAQVRDQGIYGTCWAFAALGALESSLLPEEDAQYSADHMTLNNGFNLTQDDGGDYTMGMAYLAAWEGPVYEADDPYGDDETDTSLVAVKHVQEMQLIDGKDFEKIKEAVFLYGGVQTSIYNALKSTQASSPYYNPDTCAYCYIGTEKPNHDVTIIGWDDTYPKENFPIELEGDGAFICQNSWGSSFGEDGVFYVSYYDTNIGTHNVAYTRTDGVDNYDTIYQSDLCGWVGQMGYSKDSIYGANVFTADGDEEIAAASFYATGKDTSYEIFIVNDFVDENSFSGMAQVASGTLGNAGYYTVDFDEAVSVDAGERFAVVLHVTTPNSVHPLAIEYRADEMTADVVLDDGESYISANGSKWVSADTVEECNLCIKAFGRKQ